MKDDSEKLIETLRKHLIPVGAIMMFPYGCAPACFLSCDGRKLSKAEFPELFELIGNTFGETTDMFCLPDLRGKFVRGYDSSGIYDTERAIGDYQEDALQGHSHATIWSEDKTGENGAHNHTLYGDNGKWYVSDSDRSSRRGGILSGSYSDYKDGQKTSSEGLHSHTLPELRIGEVCTTNHGRVKVANETRPKNICLNFCIKVK